jgi:hypothetical protein
VVAVNRVAVAVELMGMPFSERNFGSERDA